MDNLHSIYVDQWDWEKVIREEDRNETYLKNVVRSIVSAVCATEMNLHAMFPQLQDLPLHTPNVTFITTQELEDKYPDLTPKERENAFVKENGTTFLMKIGAPLKSGKPHDGRAPDYDDWDLNGDLLFWNEPLQCSYELSSMGIRVSPESMDRQLTAAGCDDRRTLPFHKAVLNGELPYTIGGGIGQSRLCMLLLGSAHIGEVQASVWDAATREACEKAGHPAAVIMALPLGELARQRLRGQARCQRAVSAAISSCFYGSAVIAVFLHSLYQPCPLRHRKRCHLSKRERPKKAAVPADKVQRPFLMSGISSPLCSSFRCRPATRAGRHTEGLSQG